MVVSMLTETFGICQMLPTNSTIGAYYSLKVDEYVFFIFQIKSDYSADIQLFCEDEQCDLCYFTTDNVKLKHCYPVSYFPRGNDTTVSRDKYFIFLPES